MKKYLFFACCAVLAVRASAQPSERLTADEYRLRVLGYSAQVKQSGEQAEAMRQSMREAKTSFLPMIDFSGSGQYRVTDYNLDFAGTKVSMAPESYSVNADVNQVVYAGGAVKQGYKAAQVQYAIAQKNEELTVSNIVYAANLNYWSTAAKEALYQLTSRYVQLIEELTGVIRERFNEGLISKTDLLQIEARLSEARIQNSEAWKSYQLALQNLNILMGSDPMNSVELADQIDRGDEIPAAILPLEAALMRRVEFEIAEMNVDYQLRRLKIERSKYLPQFVVGMKNGWGTQTLNFDGSRMFNSYVYGQLNIPLFRWGAKYKNVASQRALVRSKELDLQITRDQVSQELNNAYTSLVESKNQIAVSEESCEISKQSLDLNTFSYNEGKLPIVDVLSAQVAWVQAHSSLIQAWLQEKSAFADYNKAIGNLEY